MRVIARKVVGGYSNRRDSLPPKATWNRLKAAVKARDAGRCQECGGVGTEVDHIKLRGDNIIDGVPTDDHSMDNLQLLCTQCHARKTGREGGRARARNQRKNGRFDTGPHPAYLRPGER